MGRIVAAHQQFEAETQSTSMGPRERKLRDLASAYDAFMELQGNLTEGSKVRVWGDNPVVSVN